MSLMRKLLQKCDYIDTLHNLSCTQLDRTGVQFDGRQYVNLGTGDSLKLEDLSKENACII